MPFTYLLNVIMASRLFYGFKDHPVSPGKLLVIIAFQLVFLTFLELSLKLLLLIFVLTVLDILFYFLEQKSKKINSLRLLFIIVAILLFGTLSSFLIPDSFNQNFINFLNAAGKSSVLISEACRMNWQLNNIVLCGALLLLNEMNFGIRWFFGIFELMPRERGKNTELIDNKEYNTGRVIGMLERMLIFFFVLSQQYEAIGFIIAAKGFTRFKELDDRNFAEYVLVGTLLSSLSAIIVALIIKGLMN